MKRIHSFGRIVDQITSEEGELHYYDYMNYWHSCYVNTNLRIAPTRAQAEEYIKLREEKPSLFGDLTERKRYRKLQAYENNYDWRPKKSGDKHFIGLVSPTGEQLLPNIFEDTFTQFDAMTDNLKFIPVSNGKGWALASLESTTTLMTEFLYNAIIPERWERKLFFVQNKQTMKWGVLRSICQSTNNKPQHRHSLTTLESVMPCIADEIYEDEILVDDPEELPSLFFMTRRGDKVGILTDFGYSPIIYDTYEVDTDECSFQLIRKDRNCVKYANWWNPSGK